MSHYSILIFPPYSIVSIFPPFFIIFVLPDLLSPNLPEQKVLWCDFLPDSRGFVTVTETHCRLWSLEILEPLKSLKFKGFYGSKGAIFPDGKRLCLSGKMDLFLVDLNTFRQIGQLQGSCRPLGRMVWLVDGHKRRRRRQQ